MNEETTVMVAPNRLRAFAALRGLTLKRLANLARMPHATLTRALRRGRCRLGTLVALALALDVKPESLGTGCPYASGAGVEAAPKQQRKTVR